MSIVNFLLREKEHCFILYFLVQAEREQRYALKKELDAKNNTESMFQLGNLALSIQGMSESGAPSSMGSEGDEESPVFKKMGEGEEGEEGNEQPEDSAPAEDLFSEIHLGQLKKLERQLDTSEGEKQNLTVNMKELQSNLDITRSEATAQKAKVAELLAYLVDLDKLASDENSRLFKAEVTDAPATLDKHRTWQSKVVAELESLRQNLVNFQVEDQETYNSVSKISDLKQQIMAQEKTLLDLTHDIKIMDSLSNESQTVLGLAQNELSNVTEELAKIYHHICTANNVTPSRVMLEHSKGN